MACDEYRRISKICLGSLDRTGELDLPKTVSVIVGLLRLIEKRTESGIAVHARKTGPDKSPGRVHKSGHLAIADRPKVEGRPQNSVSQWCTAATSGSQYCAAVGRGSPTRTPAPPNSAQRRNPGSSVRSSPRKRGSEFWNGCMLISAAIPLPLSCPALRTSTIILPC